MADAEVVVGIKGDASDFKREVSGLGEATGKALSSAAKIGIAAIGTAFAAGGVALGAFAKKGIGLASDLDEVQNVVDTTFGGMSKSIDSWAKTTGAQYGVSELAAKQYSSTIGAMMKSAGVSGDGLKDMSTGIAALSGDMASFYNLDPAEAFEKLRSGISGESEPLKQLGIDVSDTALQTYALTQGITKTTAEMSQSEKMTLRYGLIMQQTADSQGDFAKTSDGYANQQRILGMNIDTLAASFGSMLLPALNGVVTFLNKSIVPAVQGFLDLVKGGTDPVTAFAKTMETSFGIDVTPITDAITFLMDGFKQIGDPAALSGFDSVMYNIGSTIGSIVDAIPFLVDGISGLGDPAALSGVDSAMYGIGAAIGTILDTAKGVVEWVGANKEWLAPLAVGVLAMVAAWKAWTVATTVWSGITKAAAAVQAAFNAVMAMNPIGLVVLAIIGLVAAFVYLWKTNEGFRDFFITAWETIKGAAIAVWDAVSAAFTVAVEAITAAATAVVAWLTGIWTGVTEAWTTFTTFVAGLFAPVFDGIRTIFEGIATYFTGFWEVVKGIFMGALLLVIDLFTGNFTQLQADAAMIWEKIMAGVQMMWDGIGLIFSGAIAVVVGYFDGFKTLISGAADAIRDFVVNAFETLKEKAVAAVLGLKDSAVTKFTELVDWVRNLPGNIVTALGNLSDLLKDAGKKIITGLWDGLKDKWEAAKEWVKGIADWIRENKGPLSYDAKLLIPAGEAMMDGFRKGLSSGFDDVRALVSGMGAEVSTDFVLGSVPSVGLSGGAMFGGSSTTTNYYYQIGDVSIPADDAQAQQVFGDLASLVRRYSRMQPTGA